MTKEEWKELCDLIKKVPIPIKTAHTLHKLSTGELEIIRKAKVQRVVDVNLSDDCWVQLTDVGRQKLWEQHAESFLSSEVPYRAPEEDEDGWSKWQTFDIFSRLGKYIMSGHESFGPIRTRIKVQAEAPLMAPEAYSSAAPLNGEYRKKVYLSEKNSLEVVGTIVATLYPEVGDSFIIGVERPGGAEVNSYWSSRRIISLQGLNIAVEKAESYLREAYTNAQKARVKACTTVAQLKAAGFE